MKIKPDIALFGTGHLAWKLGEALHNAGFPISSVWGRNRSDKQALARLLNARALEKPEEGGHPAVKLLAVRDDYVPELAALLPPDEASLVVHCAGAGALQWLEPHARKGVFWPLQSIRRERNYDWQAVPILVEAERPDDLTILLELGQALSGRVQAVRPQERALYHLAAVITANFSNLLQHQAFALLQQQKLDHRLLVPILQYQLAAFESQEDPLHRQTGPARRGDQATMEKQLQLLADYPDTAATYRLLSALIRQLPRT